MLGRVLIRCPKLLCAFLAVRNPIFIIGFCFESFPLFGRGQFCITRSTWDVLDRGYKQLLHIGPCFCEITSIGVPEDLKTLCWSELPTVEHWKGLLRLQVTLFTNGLLSCSCKCSCSPTLHCCLLLSRRKNIYITKEPTAFSEARVLMRHPRGYESKKDHRDESTLKGRSRTWSCCQQTMRTHFDIFMLIAGKDNYLNVLHVMKAILIRTERFNFSRARGFLGVIFELDIHQTCLW